MNVNKHQNFDSSFFKKSGVFQHFFRENPEL